MSEPPFGWLPAAWPDARAVGGMTTRRGGTSAPPFDAFNLRQGLGDDPAAVDAHQRMLAEALGATPVWLQQVHGHAVVRLDRTDLAPDAPVRIADASVTTEPGIACAVQVADCLPVLFAAPDGRAVGAAHAGWRGLAGGVVERTLAAVCEAASCRPDEVAAWLGACIGPMAFEVGADVLEAFGAPRESPGRRFVPGRPGHWLADLAGLARDRLAAAGVRHVAGADACTFSDPSTFFSFRRDRLTGRMAAVVRIERAARALQPPAPPGRREAEVAGDRERQDAPEQERRERP